MEIIRSLTSSAPTVDTEKRRAVGRKPAIVPMEKPAQPVVDICPVCKGRGYLRYDVPFGHPQFGKIKKCQCLVVAQVRKGVSTTYSWLGAFEDQVAEMEAMTFANFDPRANGQDVGDAYRKARGYADALTQQVIGQKNALLIGPYGVGKTHLACAIMNQARRAGVGCLLASGNELFQRIFESDFDESYLKKATEVDVLCLDDLDKMQVKKMQDGENGSYQKTTLFTLLNARYVAKKPTIVTANADEDWRKWLHPAVLSRLFGKGKVEAMAMQGRDFRMIGTK